MFTIVGTPDINEANRFYIFNKEAMKYVRAYYFVDTTDKRWGICQMTLGETEDFVWVIEPAEKEGEYYIRNLDHYYWQYNTINGIITLEEFTGEGVQTFRMVPWEEYGVE